MKDRLPSVPLVRQGFVAVQVVLFVECHAEVGTLDAVPLIVSHTRVVPAIRWPQPVVAPAGPQSSPPGMPPRNKLIGKLNACVSPVHDPRLLTQLAPEAVQL